MLRFLLRKLWLILIIFALLTWFKQATAPISETVGSWISGAREMRITQAFHEMVAALSNGDGIQDTLEVFRETLQD